MTDAFGRMSDTERYVAISSAEILKDALKTEQDETARLKGQIETIMNVADTYGRRIETAMEGCDKIMELCISAPPVQLRPRLSMEMLASLEETWEAMEAVGEDPKDAAALRALLDWHYNFSNPMKP